MVSTGSSAVLAYANRSCSRLEQVWLMQQVPAREHETMRLFQQLTCNTHTGLCHVVVQNLIP